MKPDSKPSEKSDFVNRKKIKHKSMHVHRRTWTGSRSEMKDANSTTGGYGRE
ncbi:hypothetical protein DM860_017970 [Cuscuta australis]|uniref:Uncharacterized protein n=1 Tax=Cuscuta australis TaxID=267555 RepID=A0A328DXW0_9ASTE|nr:hypothetical protein DM860_017970 [Cuscuta australis]